MNKTIAIKGQENLSTMFNFSAVLSNIYFLIYLGFLSYLGMFGLWLNFTEFADAVLEIGVKLFPQNI